MREALAKMMKGTPVAEATTPEAPAVETTTLVLPDAANKALGTALDGYLAIGKALAGDTTTDIGVSARSLAEALDALLAMSIPNHPHFWHEHPEAANAKEQAEELAKVKSLDDARRKFSVLSNQLSKLLHATGIPKAYGKKLGEAHCPMYPEGEKGGAVWIQAEGTVKNPFFGKAMLSCADWQRPLKVAK